MSVEKFAESQTNGESSGSEWLLRRDASYRNLECTDADGDNADETLTDDEIQLQKLIVQARNSRLHLLTQTPSTA